MNLLRWSIALVLCCGSVLAQEAHDLRLARAVKPGQKFKVDARVAYKSKMVTRYEGLPSQTEEMNAAVKLTGELTIVDVTTKGMAKELKLKLDEVEAYNDGEKAPLFKEGDVIHMKHGTDKDSVSINEEEAEGVQAELIDALLNVAGDNEATDDEIFVPPGKVKVGDEWAGKADVLIAELERQKLSGLKPADLTATARVVETTKVGEEPALRVACEMKFSSKRVTVGNLGDTLKAKSVSAEVRSEMDMPIDVTALAMRAKSMVKFNVEATGTFKDEEGVDVPVRVTMDRQAAIDATETPIK